MNLAESTRKTKGSGQYAGRSCALMREHILAPLSISVGEAIQLIKNHYKLGGISDQEVVYRILRGLVEDIQKRKKE